MSYQRLPGTYGTTLSETMKMRAVAPYCSQLLLHLLTHARTISSFSYHHQLFSRHNGPSSTLLDMTKIAPSSKLSSNAAVVSSSTLAETTTIVGNGDYVGLSATFSSSSNDINNGGVGKLIPVPEHLVPESMIEWGDIPTYLEVLSSEDIITLDHDDSSDDKKEQKLERTVITVLPEVGCGIDNLETTEKVEEFHLQQHEQSDSRFVTWKETAQEHEVVALDKSTEIGGVKVLNIETIFQVDSEVVITDDNNEDTAPAAQSENNEEQTSTIYPRRIRISLNIDRETNCIIKDTITLNVERLYSNSTKGTRWSGPKSNSGGLDARSVLNHIGRDIVYGDVFAVKRIKSGEDVWTLTSLDSVGGGGNEDDGGKETSVLRTLLDDVGVTKENGASSVTIRLPQNIMLRYGTGICCNGEDNEDKWGIELSHFQRRADSKLYRRAVFRSFESSVDIFGSVCYRKD